MSSTSPTGPAEVGDEEDRSVLERPERTPDRTWRYGAHHDHVADVYLPEPAVDAAPLLVLIHGGFWRPEYDRTHLRPLAAALADHGGLVVSIEYRRIPGSPDTTVSDLHAALAQLSGEPWATGHPMVLLGHSAGGHLALLLTDLPEVVAVVALAPVADLHAAHEQGLDGDAVRAFIGADARPDLDPTQAAPPGAPVVILHGARDSLVPLALSEAYAQAHGTRTSLITLPETGHFELIDPQSDAFAEVLTAVRLAGIE